MVLGTRSSFQAALDKGARLRPAITPLGPSRFLVNGSSGARYLVRITTVGIECACRAGQLGNPCYHAGWLFLTRVAAGLPVSLAQAVERDGASAPMQERSGLGVGMVGRWLEDDDRSPLDLLGATA